MANGNRYFMARDRIIGAALVIGAVIGVFVYGFLVFYPPTGLIVLKISAFAAVLAILAILGWIGYVMATTPPPVPLEPEPATTTTTGTTDGTAPTSAADKPQQA